MPVAQPKHNSRVGRIGIQDGAVCHMRAISAGGEAVGLVDEMAEGAPQGEGSGGEGGGGFAVSGALVVVAPPSETGPSKLWLSP